MPRTPPPESVFWKLWEGVTRANVLAFRLTGGRVGGAVGRAKILLLHHVGRRSGKARVSPLIFLADGDDAVVVASKGGVDQHPAWFHNLMAMETTEVELPGRERRAVRPRVASEAERAELWPRLVRIYRPFSSYQEATARQIPVVVLEPAQPA